MEDFDEEFLMTFNEFYPFEKYIIKNSKKINDDGAFRNYDVRVLENNAHLWTIEDAKDGDVLTNNCSVFILRKLDTAGKPIAYCGIVEGVFYEASGYRWTERQCYPATEEQRDLLDQKMKKAGCCLDFEKL